MRVEILGLFESYMQHRRSKVNPAPRHKAPAEGAAKIAGYRASFLWLAVIVACGVYVNALPNAFVYDDRYYVEYHPTVPEETLGLLTSDFLGYGGTGRYRPLTLLTFRANYLLDGFDPFGYRLTNVLLHGANTGLVYLLVWVLIGSHAAALFTGLLFAVHPIHTEAVAWVSGRSELLVATLLLTSWLFYLRATETRPFQRSGLWPSLLIFFMALFAKEQAMTFPSVLVLSDVYRYCRDHRPVLRYGELARELGSRLWLYASYMGLVGFYLLLQHLILRRPFFLPVEDIFRESNPLLSADLLTRIFTGLKVLGYYMGLLVWPRHLSVDYSYNQIPLEPSMLNFSVLWPTAIVVLLLAASLWWFTRAQDLGFAVLFFFVTLLPVANIVFPIGTIMAERLLYLPSLGWCLFAGCSWMRFLEWCGPRTGMRRAGFAVVAGMFLLLGYRTVERNKDWRNERELWQSALKVSPNSVKVRQNLAVALLEHGEREAAMAQFREALKIYPRYAETYLKMGTLYAKEGRLNKAIEVYRRAAALTDEPEIYLNLGAALMRTGAIDEAIEIYRKAIESVADARIYLNLGVALIHKERIDEAIESYEQATRIKPEFVVPYFNLGNAYLRRKDFDQAIKAYRRAIELDPDYYQAYNNLAYAYKEQGDVGLAARAAKAAERARQRVGGSGVRIERKLMR